jgi:HK97 family phage prohead protease
LTEKAQSAGLETKQFPALLSVKSIDKQARRITAIASTGNIDRDGEIILPEAFRESLLLYMKNPVVLAAHQHRLDDGRSPVVANIVSAGVTPAGLEVVIEFHDITGIAEEYWQLYSRKIQRALSVAYISIEGSYEQRNGKSVFVHTKVELLEISCVPVPSNREALTKSKQRKLDFVNDKKQQRIDEKLLDELRVLDPDFDTKCDEFAKAILGFDDVEADESDSDFFDIDNDKDVDDYSELICGKKKIGLKDFSF